MIKSGLLLSASNISVALIGLARNILIARLISVDDFGIASTFAITMAVLEMTSNFAIDRMLVQARDGDAAALQSTAHAMQAARGLIGAVVMLLAAHPLAALFGIPDAAWAYQVLAILPFLRGFLHLDIYRMQREMHFLPVITVDVVAQVLATVAAFLLALHFGDYRAMLYALVLQQAAYIAVSHLVAERPYRWRWDRAIAVRFVRFGWPLLLNGLLMFGIFYGDRIIVGSLVGMKELGWFTAAFTFTQAPSLVMTSTLTTFFMPQLARVRDRFDEFNQLHLVCTQAAIFAGVALVLVFATAGPTALVILYGEKYHSAQTVLVLLSVVQGIRLARAGPAIVAVACGRTTLPLFANIMRALFVPIAWAAVTSGHAGVLTMVAIGIIGECFAFALSLLVLQSREGVRVRALLLPIFAAILSIGLVIGFMGDHGSDILPLTPWLRYTLLLTIGAFAYWSISAFREWKSTLLGQIKTSKPAR